MMDTLEADHHDVRLTTAHKFLAENRSLMDFAYSGALPLGDTWAFSIARHRDSEILEQSNWHVIQTDMQERFPDDVEVVWCSHWAVGWIEHLAVRLIDDEETLTDAGHAILEWKERLDDYPVADDEDLSEREHEALWENFESDLAEYSVRDNLPDDWRSHVFDEAVPELNNDGSNYYGTDLHDELLALGYLAL